MNKVSIKKLYYIVSYHCNLTCDTCVALSPYSNIEFSDLDEFTKDINRIATSVYANKIEFIGGEPLLNKDLVKYIQIAKQSGISPATSISTNGILLHKMSDEFYSNIDRIIVSQYPSTNIDYERIEQLLLEKQKKYNFIFKFKKFDTFLDVYRDVEETDNNITQDVYDTCMISTKGTQCFFVEHGKFYKCSPSLILKRYRSECKDFKDYLDIYQDNLKDRLEQFLYSETFLDSCRFCTGTKITNNEKPHKLLTQKEIKFYKTKYAI